MKEKKWMKKINVCEKKSMKSLKQCSLKKDWNTFVYFPCIVYNIIKTRI